MLLVLLVVINSGASLSVWKDAERKAALWERRRGRGRRSRWNLIGSEYENESLIQLPGFGAVGLFWAAVTRVCVYVCGCVCVCMHTSVHMVQSNSWSHQIFVVGLATVRVCVCVCWRKMKVVWRANHNIEARFKRRYLSSFAPALKSPLLHYHSVYHSSSIVASICFWQLINFVYIDYSLFMDRSLVAGSRVHGWLISGHVCQTDGGAGTGRLIWLCSTCGEKPFG